MENLKVVITSIFEWFINIITIKLNIPTISDTKVAIIFIIIGTPIVVIIGILAITSKIKKGCNR